MNKNDILMKLNLLILKCSVNKDILYELQELFDEILNKDYDNEKIL